MLVWETYYTKGCGYVEVSTPCKREDTKIPPPRPFPTNSVDSPIGIRRGMRPPKSKVCLDVSSYRSGITRYHIRVRIPSGHH